MAVARWTVACAALAGILLAAVGLVMEFAYIFPQTTCVSGGNDGVCSITGHPVSLPTLVGGAALAIAALVALRVMNRHASSAPKD